MGRGWSVADMQEGGHKGLMIYRKGAREATWGINGLSQTCEKPSAGYGWSVTDVKERNNGGTLVFR